MKFSKLCIMSALCFFISSVNAAERCRDVIVDEYTLYYGEASCVPTDNRYGLVCEELRGHSGGWEEPFITLSATVFCEDDYSYGYYSKNVSCDAYLPHSRTERITEEVCEDVPYNTVARAKVNTNEMIVYKQECSWNGWRSYTMVRQNDLYCDGARIATVVDYTGQPYTDDNCYVDFHDNDYTRSNPGSHDTCDIRIHRYLD